MEPNVTIIDEPVRVASHDVARDGELTQEQRVRSIVAGSAGNLVEWYDFYVYAFTALCACAFVTAFSMREPRRVTMRT
jgi:hypothetical protein